MSPLHVSFDRRVVSEAFELAILAPSLIAETAPLWLFWHFHLLVWQVSTIMAASWVFTWWLTWTVISVAKSRRYARWINRRSSEAPRFIAIGQEAETLAYVAIDYQRHTRLHFLRLRRSVVTAG